MKNTIEIDRGALDELRTCGRMMLDQMYPSGDVPVNSLLARAVEAATVALAQPAAPEKPAPIRWQDYPWLPEGWKPYKKPCKWFAVHANGMLVQTECLPECDEDYEIWFGYAGVEPVWDIGHVNLNGTDWRTTLREILP